MPKQLPIERLIFKGAADNSLKIVIKIQKSNILIEIIYSLKRVTASELKLK